MFSWIFTVENVGQGLSKAIQLANILNRTLVIPPIPYPKSKGYCLTCAYNPIYCLYDVLKTAKLGFRESVQYETQRYI